MLAPQAHALWQRRPRGIRRFCNRAGMAFKASAFWEPVLDALQVTLARAVQNHLRGRAGTGTS